MTPCFAVRTTLLKELMADKEAIEKLRRATTMLEVEQVLRQYAKKKGFKVAQIVSSNSVWATYMEEAKP